MEDSGSAPHLRSRQNNLEQVAVLAGLDSGESPGADVFSQATEMSRSLRLGWDAKLGPDALETIHITQHLDETLTTDALGIFDNDWFMDFPPQNY